MLSSLTIGRVDQDLSIFPVKYSDLKTLEDYLTKSKIKFRFSYLYLDRYHVVCELKDTVINLDNLEQLFYSLGYEIHYNLD